MCSRQVTYGCSGGSKEVVSKDTNVEEKVVPVGNVSLHLCFRFMFLLYLFKISYNVFRLIELC